MKLIFFTLLAIIISTFVSVARGDHVPIPGGSGPANVLCGSLESAERALVEPEDVPAPDDCMAFLGSVRVVPQQYMKTVDSFDGNTYEIYAVLTPDGKTWFTFTRAPGTDA